LIDNGLASLVGFEPDRACFDKLQAIKGPRESYYPSLSATERPISFAFCRMSGMNSLLAPNFDLPNLLIRHAT
jgi:protein O-GlcNAc transferase